MGYKNFPGLQVFSQQRVYFLPWGQAWQAGHSLQRTQHCLKTLRTVTPWNPSNQLAGPTLRVRGQIPGMGTTESVSRGSRVPDTPSSRGKGQDPTRERALPPPPTAFALLAECHAHPSLCFCGRTDPLGNRKGHLTHRLKYSPLSPSLTSRFDSFKYSLTLVTVVTERILVEAVRKV